MSIPFDQINAAALAQYPGLLQEWLPSGKLVGREYVAGDLRGSPGDSLSINVRTGAWADFASDERGGDPISLVAALFCRGDQVAAAKRLGRELGVYLNGAAQAVQPHAPPSKTDTWVPAVPPPADAAAPDLSGYDVVHTYRDAAGRPLFYVRRREGRSGKRKMFTPLTWGTLDSRTGWHAKHPVAPRPLYGLDRLATMPDAVAIVCEGEKAADAAQRMFPGRPCVSWPGGTGGVAMADWHGLSGRDVVIWPDNDEPGQKAARDIARRLSGVAASVLMLPVSDLPDKADAADIQPDDAEAWLQDRLARIAPPAAADEPPSFPDDPGYFESLEVVAKETKSHAPARPVRRAVELPPIRIVDGEIDLLADRGEAALRESGLPVFQRGRSLVRPVRQEVPTSRGGTVLAPSLCDLSTPGLVDLLNQAVEWQRFKSEKIGWRPTNPPEGVAKVILSRSGSWNLPPVAGVITTPTLRPDGSLLHEPGYDKSTRLFHVADRTLKLDQAVHNPTRADADRAIDLLQDLLSGFPFVSDVDRSVALSALITGVTRGAMAVAPMHAFRAFTAGSGKSYLADLMSYIATGRACPVMAVAAKEDETEKRLVGLLLAGFPIISIDNVNGDLGGDLLCQAVERPLVRVRALGKSDILEIESRASIIATGNGFRVKGDMTRRTLICTLDAKMERPELRTFDFDPVERVMADRGAYVSACLTIVGAYLRAKRKPDLSPIASFGEWSTHVRGALVWLGCEDPVKSMEVARGDDPELSELRELAAIWRDRIGLDVKLTTAEVTARIDGRQQDDYGNPGDYIMPDLRSAVHGIAGERGALNARKFGKWMHSRLGKIVDGVRFEQGGHGHGGAIKWVLKSL